MNNKYNLDLKILKCMTYLWKTYLQHYHCRFVQCYINQILHFKTIVISRDKEVHAMLKKQLSTSTSDFKKMIDDIKLLLINQIYKYCIIMTQIRMWYFMKLCLSIFNEIVSHIISYALRLIDLKYQKLIDQSTTLNQCIKFFFTTNELLCNHKIQKQLFRNKNILLKDCHVHWRWENCQFLIITWTWNLKFSFH